MRPRKLAGILCLVLVLGAGLWLVTRWYQIFGDPSAGPRVVITATLDADLRCERGSVESTSGSYIRAREDSGRWPLTYGIPLAILVALAAITPGRMVLGSSGR